ncbi:Zinc finger C2H2-type protein [Macrophomina phaseolina MS6]|uniref:Zinc finger C2H2-type protein n=1 Tax=Macrophomina phaseolina (strain MS6) TaxID=1126212 RepID=K2R800_MACPH|nr:Zinc finger C2H2-type protein [Macrophomina phaseolina MS6]
MSGKQRRVYKCSTCARVFKRSEHCSRHERIHTRERPFSCQYCHKRYARKDLVTRHEKTLHSEKRRQSIATVVPDSPDSPRSSESSDTINVSIPSNASSHPDQTQAFEPGKESPPAITLTENPPPMATSAELSPQELAVGDGRRGSIMIPADVATPTFGFGNTVEALYPSPQSCPEQVQVTLQPWNEHVVALQDMQMQPTFMPIDPQLCEPHQSLNLDAMSHRGSLAPQPAVASIESRNDSMDAAQDTMGPPTKRRRLASGRRHTIDIQPTSRLDWQHDLDAASIDIFRDFWSPPEPPSDVAPSSMDSLITPDSLDFSIPIDPFLMGGQEFSTQQQNDSLFSPNFGFAGSTQGSGSTNWQPFIGGNSQASRETSSEPLKLPVSETIYRSICGDLQARMRKEEWNESKLLSAQELQKFIESYISCFHRHFPIIHFPSLSLESTPSPLILAICCIGALYRLDRRRATILYELASPLLQSAISSSRRLSPPSPGPLWAVQGSLLLAMYAVFSGRSGLVVSNIENTGLLVTEYRLRRMSLIADLNANERTWEDWSIRESSKRLLCGILILSNLLSITYGTNPWFSVGEDLQVELPSRDNLWDARTTGKWLEIRKNSRQNPPKTIKNAILDSLSQEQHSFPPKDQQRVSGFVNLVIAHATNIHVWHLSQLSQCLAPGNNVTLLADASTSLDRCSHALSYGGSTRSFDDYRHPYSADAHSSLAFNTSSLLRIASTRLLAGSADSFNRFVLASDSKHDVAAAAKAFLQASSTRDALRTSGAERACEFFRMPAKVGSLLVRKTAAFGWSIEIAVAWWDTALFLTKWVHAVQTAAGPESEDERRVLEMLRTYLKEISVEEELFGGRGGAEMEEGSLAARVARACAVFLEDTWVWGGELNVHLGPD